MKYHFDWRAVRVWAVMPLAVVLLAGCATTGKRPPVTVSIHRQASPALPQHLIRLVHMETTGVTLYVNHLADLTERDIERAELDTSTGGPYVRLIFNDFGKRRLQWLTTECRNQRVVIFFDNKPVAVHYITRTISDGRLTVLADLPEEEVRRIIDDLQPKKLEKR